MIIPKLKISAVSVYGFALNTSGAMYHSVPHAVPLTCLIGLASPMSARRTLLWVVIYRKHALLKQY